MLAFASSTVSGMTSKTIGLAIREFLVTTTGMHGDGVHGTGDGAVTGISFARKSSSVKKTSTAE